MIRVILWDIDGTLLNFEAAERAAIRACFAEFSLGKCTDEMLSEYHLINHRYWGMLERGEITKPELLTARFREFFENHGLPTDQLTEFNDRYQIALGDTVCFSPHAMETVQMLSGHVRQYAVSNGTRIAQRRKLRNSGLDQFFDGIFISDEIGAEKPSPAFFDAVWTQIGDISREEVLIVGDSLTSDMQGGNSAGIRCGWYCPEGAGYTGALRIDYEIRDLEEVAAICGVTK